MNSSDPLATGARRECFDAIMMAGSINKIPLFPGCAPGPKALIKLHGRPLIDYVLDALRDSAGVSRTLVIGHPLVLEHVRGREGVEGVTAGGSLVDNAWRGLAAGKTERLLYCNPDQPLLTGVMVDDFLNRAAPVDADLVSSWVPLAALQQDCPEGDHKFTPFGDGRFAHGNLFLVRRKFPEGARVRRRMDALYQARKKPLQFAWALGPRLFLGYVSARLRGKAPTLEQTLDTAGKTFGFHLAGVLCPYPEIVLDLDEPEDYTAADRQLSAMRARPQAPAPT